MRAWVNLPACTHKLGDAAMQRGATPRLCHGPGGGGGPTICLRARGGTAWAVQGASGGCPCLVDKIVVIIVRMKQPSVLRSFPCFGK